MENDPPIIGALKRPVVKRELYGVHGWLKFLCVLLFFGAFTGVVRAATASMLGAFDLIETAIALAIAGFAAYAGLGLIRIWPNALPVAKAYCLVAFALRLFDCVSAFVDGDSTATKMGISASIFTGAWVAYLYLSDRVHNTYARPKVEATSGVFS